MNSERIHGVLGPAGVACAFVLAGGAGDVSCGSWLTCTWDRVPNDTSRSTAVELVAGGDLTCARLTSGHVKCWGSNMGGPGFVDPITNAARIFVGTDGTLVVIDVNGEAHCGSTFIPNCPIEMQDEAAGRGWGNFGGSYDFMWAEHDPELDGSVDVATGDEVACRIDSAGGAMCWEWRAVEDDTPWNGFRDEVVEYDSMFDGDSHPPSTRLIALAIAPYQACALAEDATVYCWWLLGADDFGLPLWAAEPVLHADMAPIVAIASDATAILALDAFGTVQRLLWRTDEEARASERFRPSEPGIQLAAGDAFVCVLLESGRIECNALWGDEVETSVRALRGVTQIAAGRAHACALLEGGSVWCWGENDADQLGRLDPNGGGPEPVHWPE